MRIPEELEFGEEIGGNCGLVVVEVELRTWNRRLGLVDCSFWDCSSIVSEHWGASRTQELRAHGMVLHGLTNWLPFGE